MVVLYCLYKPASIGRSAILKTESTGLPPKGLSGAFYMLLLSHSRLSAICSLCLCQQGTGFPAGGFIHHRPGADLAGIEAR